MPSFYVLLGAGNVHVRRFVFHLNHSHIMSQPARRAKEPYINDSSPIVGGRFEFRPNTQDAAVNSMSGQAIHSESTIRLSRGSMPSF